MAAEFRFHRLYILAIQGRRLGTSDVVQNQISVHDVTIFAEKKGYACKSTLY